ncbi:MAG TPA: amidase [Pseudolabrys sp.]|nr:amidase [Pseudolabrys sp.]
MSAIPIDADVAIKPPPDIAAELGLRSLSAMLSDRSLTAEALTSQYLQRLASIDPKLSAFAWHNAEALQDARTIDRRRAAGDDLGPLWGLPVAVKQIFSVSNFPSSPATALDVTAKISPEGTFIKALKRAGVVLLGLTRTTEFAAATINITKPAPWNPWDRSTKRVCGGSSHGSAAAQAAGLCSFAVGSDTGGSVRFPAAMCGVVGFKPTHGRWPIDGVFPLSPTFDTIGIFANSAADLAFICASLGELRIGSRRPEGKVTLGYPHQYSVDLHPGVASAFEAAVAKLRAGGIDIVGLDLPEVSEVPGVFGRILGAELVAFLGRDTIESNKDRLDPVVWARVETELATSASELERLRRRHFELVQIVKKKTAHVDAVVGPTTPFIPAAERELSSPEAAIAWNRRSASHTRPGNLFGMCGISLPLPPANGLPTSLQLLCPPGEDEKLIGLAESVERMIGRPQKPDMTTFSGSK